MLWTIAGVLLVSALIANHKHQVAERSKKTRLFEERVQKAAVDRAKGMFPMPGTEDPAFEAVLAGRGIPNRPSWPARNPKGMWHQGIPDFMRLCDDDA